MPTPSLAHLIYCSSASHEMSEAELLALLQQSRRRNAELRVTGMLVYGGGVFLQVLEGLAVAVDMLYQKIERDPRHHSLILLEREPIAARSFPEWSMGFQSLTQDAGLELAGAFSLRGTEHGLGGRNIMPGMALNLLQQFARHQR